MLIEIHMIKNYPSTNLNRDDTGAPKSCIFGGVTRGRISSQCLKRSWRQSPILNQVLGENAMGIRTRKMPQLVSEELKKMGVNEEYFQLAEKKLTGIANASGTENTRANLTAQIVIYSKQDIIAIAEMIKRKIEEAKSLEAFEKFSGEDLRNALDDANTRPITLDIALFGRMVTSSAFADVEASMQVAHAFSTNKVVMESDYFSAMDDLIDGKTDAGAAIIGDIDYNSSCYYIYASLDTDKLVKNLKNSENSEELIEKAVPALIRTMAYSNPSGKQNSFAGNTLPSAVLVECKKYPVPVSLANAFVKPVYPHKGNSLVDESVSALVNYAQQTASEFSIPVEKRLWFCSGQKYKMEDAENCNTYDQVIDGVSAALKE